jgi:dephospho-CoA kinase
VTRAGVPSHHADRWVVGLTGGIGSGKSAAADEFARLGAAVVDTDEIARRLTEPSGPAMPHIKSLFGAAFVTPAGALDREAMRRRIFSDPAAKQALEQLLHPMIRAESERLIAQARAPYVVHVVPLLIESPDYRTRVQRVLVIDAPEETQVARVQARSQLAPDEVRSIMRNQASRAERLAAADDVLDNAGSRQALREQVAALHEKYLRLAKSVPG